MPTSTEVLEMQIERALNRMASQLADSGNQLATARQGTLNTDALISGSYNSSDDYIRYEVAGDVCELYPVGP